MAASAHFIVEKDDGGGRAPVPPTEQEFIPMAGPGSIWIKPVHTPVDKNGSPVETLELPEWSMGFVAAADAAAGARGISVSALLKLGGIGVPETAVLQRSLAGAAVAWNFLPIWWDVTGGPLTFKSEVKIDITGAVSAYRVVLRLIPRSHLRDF